MEIGKIIIRIKEETKMCKAFSCVITKTRKVYWQTGMDSHNNIVAHFKLSDNKIGQICPIKITPKNGDYLAPDEWEFKFDDGMPDWWKQSHERACWVAFEKWKKEVYSKIYLRRAKKPVHPFELPMVRRVNKSQIRLLKQWASVRKSVWYSVRDSVWYSVRDSVGWSVRKSVRKSVCDSVGDSVYYSVGYSVRASVWDSIYAYVGYMFKLKRSEWKYTDKIKTKGYPFLVAVKLWQQGLVASFNGKTWRLHSGKDAKVVFEISKEELKNLNEGWGEIQLSALK
jgi:hypothetical protein